MTSVGGHVLHRTGPALVSAPVRWAWRVLCWCVILGCVAALAAGVLVPRLAGATPYTILTGSMVPHYPPGTLVVDHAPDPADVGVGQVVTYQLHSGQPEVVTHRVVAVSSDLTGRTTFTTQGDANNAPDAAPVLPEQIRGQLWYAVPYLGYANHWFTGHQRQSLVYVVAAGLALYALTMFVGAARERRRTRTTRTETAPETAPDTEDREDQPCDA